MKKQNQKNVNKEDTSTRETAGQRLHNTRKILHSRMENRYNKFRIGQIRRKKQHRLLRKKLSGREYFEYRIYEIVNGGWRRIVTFLAVLLVLVLLIAFIGRGLVFLAGRIAEGITAIKTAWETEVSTETELQTETEKIYPEKEITIGSTGCMLLHSPFITSYPDEIGNYDFSSVYQYIAPFYSEPDFMTCEFEGSLGGEELGYSGYPAFNSPDIIIENIKDSGIDLQFLATNHIYDTGSEGFHRTVEVYEEKNIDYTGVRRKETEKPYYIADIDGIKVAFINYVYETDMFDGSITLNGIPLDDGDANLINTFHYDNLDGFYEEIQGVIREAKESGAQFVIAQMHWGSEYQLTENDYQDEIAQRLCDMGINAIIGGHPHCEQPIDVLTASNGQKMFVIYSEGNALSNQRTYLMDEMPTGHTEDGAMITLTLKQNNRGEVSITDVALLPTWVYRYPDEQGLSKYFIFPLNDVENLEADTGITGIYEEALASYERTMEELEPGLKKAQEIFSAESEAETESESETITE